MQLANVVEPYEVIDERFLPLRGDVRVEHHYDGCRWAEGPVYVPAGRYLAWSDIPGDRLLRWDETTGAVGVFREQAGYPNGNALDQQGRLLTCEHGNRRITRTEPDGSSVVIADSYNGSRLNSPNDVVVTADGAVWFTDASYGIDGDYEGHRAQSEIGACNVYRVDPAGGLVTLAADGFQRPTGLAFSPDETRLYVSDSRANHIRVFEVSEGGKLAGGDVLAAGTAPSLDGMRVDCDGRIWIAALDGVQCYHPDGTLLGKIRMPAATANVAFGGARRNRLFICASTGLYSIMLAVRGATRPSRPAQH
jgi:gluconolactonase